jgi:hypothetical protein
MWRIHVMLRAWGVVAALGIVSVAGCGSTSATSTDAASDATSSDADPGATSSDAGPDLLGACSAMVPPVVSGLCVLNAQGARATDPTGIEPIAVTVASVGTRAPPAACSGGGMNGLASGAAAMEIVLRGPSSAQWTVYVSGVPAGIVGASDSLELLLIASLEANGWVKQDLVLTRASHLVLFAAAMNGTGPVTPVVPAGELVSIDGDGVVCMDDFDVPCMLRRIRARIVFGEEVGSAVPGEIVDIGKLTVALTAFHQAIDNGNCSGQSNSMVIAGYVSP